MLRLYRNKDTTAGPGTADELAQLIEELVTSGELEAGTRLPAIRAMADEVGLAPNTVAAAYRRLADRGLVVGRGRAGTFVVERPPLVAHRANPVPPHLVDLASGSPDRRLLPDLEAFVSHAGVSSSYDDPVVTPEMEEAGKDWLRGQGFEARRLVLTSGALDGIERILEARLRPGDAVAVESPGWSALYDAVRALRLDAVPVGVDEYGMVPADLARRIAGVVAVVMTPRAQNPCGAALDARRRDQLAEIIDAHPDVLVVEDDHAGPIAGTPLHPLGQGRERWAFVQSVAKALGPDLRLALVAGDDLTLDRVVGRFAAGPGWVSRILQDAVTRMMNDGSIRELMQTAAETYAARRSRLIDHAAEAGLKASGRSGLNTWIEVESEGAAVAEAAAAGFAVRGGSAFGSTAGAVRVTVSNLETDEVPRLVSALARGSGGRIV